MEKEFYVYAYLDPRKLGRYIYGDYQFDYEPFYIGKGINKRNDYHLTRIKKEEKGSHPFVDKLRKILSLGLKPIIVKIINDLSEQEAYEIEINLIDLIGRFNIKTGPLTNLVAGGKGGGLIRKGKKHSEQTKKKMSLKATGRKHSKETIELLKLKQKGKRSGNKNPQYGTCLINKEGQNKRIKKEELNNFLLQGWVKGAKFHSEKLKKEISDRMKKIDRKGKNNSCYGKIWIYHKESKQQKRIKKEDLNHFLKENWIKGKLTIIKNEDQIEALID